MKKLEIVGFKRANLGTKSANDLRNEAMAPCVLYGGSEQVHFAVPMILFRELLYSADVYEVELNIEGTKYRAILQDAQFHPVNEMIYHVDFLEIQKGMGASSRFQDLNALGLLLHCERQVRYLRCGRIQSCLQIVDFH